MATPDHAKKQEEAEALIVRQGVRLNSVSHIVFYDHQLVKENKRLNEQIISMFWNRYSHANLLMTLLDSAGKSFRCSCRFCYGIFEDRHDMFPEAECRVLKKLKEHMDYVGITYFEMGGENVAERATDGPTISDAARQQLTMVWDLEYHFVFSQRGNAFSFRYGRKFWYWQDPESNPENHKLVRLFERVDKRIIFYPFVDSESD